jgi:VIT1/CCC1 family predicted Fe2+/Mn2+ transporter
MQALDSYKEEKRSVYLYQELSKIEVNPVHQKLFVELSKLADKQAQIWEKQLIEQNIPVPTEFPLDFRSKFVIFLVKCFGPRSLRHALAAMKIRGMSIYHMGSLATPAHKPADIEQQHQMITRGNNIRAAVFGVNDGLISNASLILGIIGASAGNHFVILSGVAGMLAGACSMAAGEYVSVRSQREMLEYQLALEKSELEQYPEEEAAELSLIYQARGIPEVEAEKIAHILIQDPEKALDTLAREELGINPDDLVSPWGAAISSFFSFAIGAFIPLLPFLIHPSHRSAWIMMGLVGLALFSVGSVLSIFTQRNAIWSGIRMLAIGALAGGVTYFIGSLFTFTN